MKKIILALISSILIFSFVSCNNIWDKKESEPETEGCSTLAYYDIHEFIAALNMERTYSTYIPIVTLPNVTFRVVTVSDTYFHYYFKSDKSSNCLRISVYRPESSYMGYHEETFNSIIEREKLTADSGFAYNYEKDTGFIEVNSTFAEIKINDKSIIKKPSDIRNFITFEYNHPYNESIGVYTSFVDVKNFRAISNVNNEAVNITDEQIAEIISILNTTQWKGLNVEGRNDITLSFNYKTYNEVPVEVNLQYDASSGSFNDQSISKHAYISEIERLYLNSLFGIE